MLIGLDSTAHGSAERLVRWVGPKVIPDSCPQLQLHLHIKLVSALKSRTDALPGHNACLLAALVGHYWHKPCARVPCISCLPYMHVHELVGQERFWGWCPRA